ncbi:alanine--tRNA ligase [Candidatus Amesbacteria bacterium]|nr:alanine--tRNA ligase [Candidatus Amesbacteria bacterium]
MVKASEIRQRYLKFFADRGHKIIPSAPLVPENDPTTLFTGSGMQPMLPYLLGEPHPLGARFVDSQKCFRGQDIEEVGDNRHDTFFEMLGNWSLGDYFKKEQLAWCWEFFTKELGLSKEKLYVSVFKGDKEIPKDEETANIWKSLGVPENHIFYYDETKNWWSRTGIKTNMPLGEPGGPDSEVFYDFGTPHNIKYGPECHPNCDCGRFSEIGNSVFMTYKKTANGFVPLNKKNIDFGGGLERLASAVNNHPDIFKTDLFTPVIETLGGKITPSSRIIADHLKASVFLIADGVTPSNKARGYFLRRLLRRAMVKLQSDITPEMVESVFATYSDTAYFDQVTPNRVYEIIAGEQDKFNKTLREGLKKLGEVSPFDLFQTYGFPVEITEELYKEKGLKFDKKEFEKELQKHQDLSRTANKGVFKGGLQDHSDITTKYHTATHLLHAALRQVIGTHVQQKGSNITAERLRFDFSHNDKLTNQQIYDIENLVNQKIAEDIPVIKKDMHKEQALAEGALAFFPERYPFVTSVYQIGDFSKELCGGPHVNSTGEIGRIKITKEESAGAGIRRIYATAVSQEKHPSA